MIRNFKERKWQWVKQVEVFFVQLLDVQAAIPVVSYALEGIHSTWVSENWPCEGCTELGLPCARFRIPVTVSD